MPKAPLLVLVTVMMGACGQQIGSPPQEESAISARVIYRGDQCASQAEALDALGDERAWTAWHAAQQATSFAATIESRDTSADVDFGRASIVTISMGQRPTAGYGLDLAPSGVHLNGGTLVVDSIWVEPSPDAASAQVTTSPCIAVIVSVREYSAVVVRDQSGDIVLDHETGIE